jgi:hypothetical protein
MSRIAFFLTAAGALAAATYALPASADAPEARVTSGRSSATTRRNRLLSFHPVPANGKVAELAEVRCEERCTLQVDADNSIELSPGAVVAINDYYFVPLAAGPLARARQVELHEGRIEAVSSSRERGLPLVVSMEGTEFVALRGAKVQIARTDKHTAVASEVGTSRVASGKAWMTLEQGQRTTLGAYKPSAAPIIVAPTWAPPSPDCSPALALSDRQREVPVGGCWVKPVGAATFRVEVARDAEFKDIVRTEDVQGGTSWSTPISSGRLFARVRAADADGLVSAPSEVKALASVPVVFSAGTIADFAKHAAVIPEGGNIELPDNTGLELAVDDGGFSRAPGTLRMDDAPKHVLRLRFKNEPGTASAFTIERRALRADIEMTPKGARWPGDPIEVAVKIEDPSGLIDPASARPKFRVLIGMIETDVKWAHDGVRWTAQVEPRNVHGPTVVRVIACDEYGTPIGRNFVEVEQAPEQRIRLGNDGTRVARQ